MRNEAFIGLLVCFAAGCSQPIGPIAGNELEGEPAEWPDDWAFADDVDKYLLETNPDDPYSVTIWGITHNGEFFISAANKENQWAEFIDKDNRVRLSVDGALYSARAIRITDRDKITETTVPAYDNKYEYDYEGNFIEDGILYHIVPR